MIFLSRDFYRHNKNFIAFVPLIIGTFFWLKLQPIGLVVLVSSLFWNRLSKENILKRINYKNPACWFILYFFIHVTGTLYSQNQDLAWLDISMKLSFLVLPIFFLFVKDIDRQLVIRFFSWTGVFSAFVSLVVVFGKFFTHEINPLTSENEFSMFMHRSYQSIYWVLCLFWLVYSVLFLKRRKWLSIAGITVLITAVFLTFSKAGIIVVFLSFAVVLSLMFVRLKYYRVVGLSIIGFFILLLTINFITPKPMARLKAMIQSTFHSDENSVVIDSNNARKYMWSASLEVIQENPIIGVGTGDVHLALNEVNENKGLDALVETNLNSHNQLLNSGVALGGMGMLLFTLLFFTFIRFGEVVKSHQWMVFLYGITIFIFAMTESMFETQAGIIGFTFLMCLIGNPVSKGNENN